MTDNFYSPDCRQPCHLHTMCPPLVRIVKNVTVQRGSTTTIFPDRRSSVGEPSGLTHCYRYPPLFTGPPLNSHSRAHTRGEVPDLNPLQWCGEFAPLTPGPWRFPTQPDPSPQSRAEMVARQGGPPLGGR